MDAIESQSQNRLSDENWMEKRRGGLKDEYEVFRLKKSLEDYQDGFRLRKRDPKLHLEGFRLKKSETEIPHDQVGLFHLES